VTSPIRLRARAILAFKVFAAVSAKGKSILQQRRVFARIAGAESGDIHDLSTARAIANGDIDATVIHI
jgi:hypothetical protein